MDQYVADIKDEASSMTHYFNYNIYIHSLKYFNDQKKKKKAKEEGKHFRSKH